MKCKNESIFSWSCTILAPSLATLVLVYIVFSFFVMPEIEQTIIDRKKATISGLVEWGCTAANHYYNLCLNGKMSPEEARNRAIAQIRDMRYGSDSSDFFWVIDYNNNLVMHPYLKECEGHPLCDATAFAGIYYADEIVSQARTDGKGSIQYIESWKEDSEKNVFKLTYFQAFEPWKWVIGTSTYIDDIPAQIAQINQKFYLIFSGILALITILIGIIVSASYKIEKKRRKTEQALFESERYLRNLINSMDDLVFVIGKDGTYKHYYSKNNSVDNFTAADDSLNQHICDVLPPKVCHIHEQAVKQIEKTGLTQEYEYNLDIGDSTLWFNSKISPIKDEQGATLDYLWVIRNFTSHKFLEIGLSKLNDCFLSLGADHAANIETIVATAGEILGGAFTMYNRYDKAANSLVIKASWHLPEGFSVSGGNCQNVCFDMISLRSHEQLIVENLEGSAYDMPNSNVRRFGLKSYIGVPVWIDREIAGVFCMLDTKKRSFNDKEQKILSVLAKALVIEEKRLQAEVAHKESEQRFAALFDSSFDGIAICSLDGTFLETNTAFERITGFSADELKSRTFQSLTPEQWHRYDEEQIRTAAHSGAISYEKECLHKNGSLVPVNVTLWSINDSSQKPVRFGVYIRDLTEKKQAMETLQVQSARILSVFESIPAFVYLLADDHKVQFANKNFRDMFGDYEGKTCYELMNETDSPCPVCPPMTVLRTGEPNSWEWTSPAGRSFMIYDAPFFDIDGSPLVLEVGIDITDRKLAERKLRESKEKYRGIVDNIGIGIAIISPQMELLSINNQLRQWFPDIDITDKPLCFKTFYGEQSVDVCVSCPVKETFEDGQAHESVQECVSLDASAHFRVVTSPLKDENGTVIAAIVMVDNITDRLATERELRESEKRYRVLMESIMEGIWVVDAHGKTTFVNDAMCAMLGYSGDGMLHKHFYAFMDKRGRKIARQNIRNTKKGLRQKVEFEFLRKNGSRVFTSINTSPLFDENGAFAGAIAGITDITQQKKADDEIKKFKNISDNANYGVVITDLEGNIHYINDYFARMHGYTVEEFSGRHFSLFHSEKQMNRGQVIRKELFETGSFSAVETERIARDGSVFVMLMNGVLIKDSDGEPHCIAVTAIDITENKRIEEELFKAMKLESIGILAGGIAHDFNNLLTAIMGNVSLALLDVAPDHPHYEILKHVEEASVRAKELSHQLLTFSKGGAPVKKTTDMEEVIRYSVQFSLKGVPVETVFDIAADLHTVDVDKDQIIQVINNIVLNAKEAMPGGGVITVCARNVNGKSVTCAALDPIEYIQISIADQGTGIADNVIEKIFDPFFTTKELGSGLGLSTGYSIVKKHNGHIGVETKKGKGTVFSIFLPASIQPVKKIEQLSDSDTKGRILVMDDEPMVRDVIGKLLNRIGYETDFAAGGEEAVRLYRASIDSGSPYDVVIMDLIIPDGMGGRETMCELQKLNPEIKAIVASGYCNDPIMSNYRDYGFSAVVNKPVSINDLIQSLSCVLDRS